MKKRNVVLAVFFLIFLFGKAQVLHAQTTSFIVGADTAEKEEETLQTILNQMDFSEMSDFTIETGREKVTFQDVLSQLLKGGTTEFPVETIGEWLKDQLLYEIEGNKELLLEVILIAFCFSILKNFADSFRASYVADLCFLLVYCVLAIMLLQSFLTLQGIIEAAIDQSITFMKVLVPTFCISMVFSSNLTSMTGFYQIAFLVIYFVEWLFLKILLPMIQAYALLEVLNHFFEEDKLENIAELFHDLILWGMKAAGVAVLGLNVVQSLIGPAKDRFLQGTFGKAVGVVPGVGNLMNGVSEMLLGAGMVVKNGIGVAGLLMMLFFGMMPILKTLCLALFYKLAAAVTEPVADKRISGCIKGLSEGAVLYVKLLGYSLVFFFLTIALSVASTSFIF